MSYTAASTMWHISRTLPSVKVIFLCRNIREIERNFQVGKSLKNSERSGRKFVILIFLFSEEKKIALHQFFVLVCVFLMNI